jgi:hypothetical protein
MSWYLGTTEDETISLFAELLANPQPKCEFSSLPLTRQEMQKM